MSKDGGRPSLVPDYPVRSRAVMDLHPHQYLEISHQAGACRGKL